MLVWTDAPGHGLGGSTPAWNNDLDLVVEARGTYLGNNFDINGWSVTGGAADFHNNTEGVFLGPIPPGNLTVRVVASNINSDGLPNSGDSTDQDFALVAYNAAEVPTGACCIGDDGTCQLLTAADCAAASGIYQGDGTSCTSKPCAPCLADFDNSGDVGVKDLLFLLGAWGPCPKKGDCLADFDNSGDVGVKDLLFLLGVWGSCP